VTCSRRPRPTPDDEIKRIVERGHDQVTTLFTDRRDALDRLAHASSSPKPCEDEAHTAAQIATEPAPASGAPA
jgi:hypothetical protein